MTLYDSMMSISPPRVNEGSILNQSLQRQLQGSAERAENTNRQASRSLPSSTKQATTTDDEP